MDAGLRELERRWQASGSDEAAEAYLAARIRAADGIDTRALLERLARCERIVDLVVRDIRARVPNSEDRPVHPREYLDAASRPMPSRDILIALARAQRSAAPDGPLDTLLSTAEQVQAGQPRSVPGYSEMGLSDLRLNGQPVPYFRIDPQDTAYRAAELARMAAEAQSMVQRNQFLIYLDDGRGGVSGMVGARRLNSSAGMVTSIDVEDAGIVSGTFDTLRTPPGRMLAEMLDRGLGLMPRPSVASAGGAGRLNLVGLTVEPVPARPRYCPCGCGDPDPCPRGSLVLGG